ncbi:hypothetical protein H072_5797 [Dactylellina haptotyla CBS 200.50]|uniref:C3H1-type domain-containing protein n=1 Tax=Dactylellina haptotyla (strain CBS 200.50) TaxID=1284197 RepID=S8ABR1_DACHA|nr:hypothetical protein H072_5797 [Dactylellina haptotyla CBS 200.50]
MPPKKAEANKKAQKSVEDKTFGMKNKKGGKAQRTIKQIASQATNGVSPEEKRKAAEKAARAAEKKAADDAKKEAAALFKPLQVQKIPFGVDPKSVVCVFFKQGTCEKGKKCKFSHDLAVERKTEKRSLYDNGEGSSGAADAKQETSENWDEEKLREVVLSKHGNPKTTTDIVCRYFIQAIEEGKYGWFWTCPGGGDQCKYRHVLPPGFVVKTSAQRAAEREELEKNPNRTLTLEDFLETERHKLTGTLTPVTEETFKKWKEERQSKKAAEEELRRRKEETGKELFEKGGFQDDDSEAESSEEEVEGKGKGRADLWDLDQLRKETEALEEEQEAERIKAGGSLD